ncbi:MAG: hypothetical protein H6821_00455 [Planctomycetaceae bacterium]|nr:hypothetical protein [Planctomycetales bacterium]MCB9872621.1 hypothetical protein [Planctomycetaceae bacterium]MCB9939553.1 hypothetical protein [Planctomycetaceae bacterium]
MKGPFERLKYDLRRVWECPECHHRERADGTVTTVLCRCQANKETLDRVVMKLVEDKIQRRFPVFVPPVAAEEQQLEDSSVATEQESEEETQSEL